MIFAFLFGLSMDYEVFMLTRMREAYDETGSTEQAIELGLARTGKLVTSAALILMFAFLVLSSSPGFEIKEFAIGLAAGIIFDATVIRALLVPSLMRLMGRANWWMPNWARTALFLPSQEEEAGARRGRGRQRVKSNGWRAAFTRTSCSVRRELLLGHVAEQKLDGLRALRRGLHPVLHELRLPRDRAARRLRRQRRPASWRVFVPEFEVERVRAETEFERVESYPEYPGIEHPMRILARRARATSGITGRARRRPATAIPASSATRGRR